MSSDEDEDESQPLIMLPTQMVEMDDDLDDDELPEEEPLGPTAKRPKFDQSSHLAAAVLAQNRHQVFGHSSSSFVYVADRRFF